jgi:hypothetical protein
MDAEKKNPKDKRGSIDEEKKKKKEKKEKEKSKPEKKDKKVFFSKTGKKESEKNKNAIQLPPMPEETELFKMFLQLLVHFQIKNCEKLTDHLGRYRGPQG